MEKSISSQLNSLLKLPLFDLISKANQVRKDFIGEGLELCTILNAKSGSCPENCKFCAQSSHYNSEIPTYPLKEKEEIIRAAAKAKKIGAEKFGIVTGGNRLQSQEIDKISEAISEIKAKIGISVCGSLGALEKAELRILKNAGMKRYHHNIETSKRFYPQIVSTHSFKERINTIKKAKEVGFEVCSGGIIGMGENWQDRIAMATLLKELDVDSVPINILVPIKGTPLEDTKPISLDEIIRTICIFRIVLQDKTIKIAAGRETALADSQILGFEAGANGMLIGGYLTIKGRRIKDDYQLIEQVKKVWKE